MSLIEKAINKSKGKAGFVVFGAKKIKAKTFKKERLKKDEIEERIQAFVDGYKSGQYDFAQKLKEVLFKDPEPCCHGVREREAFEIIDNLLRDKELNYGDGT